jgi:hypothetical protein
MTIDYFWECAVRSAMLRQALVLIAAVLGYFLA